MSQSEHPVIRNRLTIAFQRNLGHRLMSHLTRRSFVWCSDTAANRRSAEAIWATLLDEQALTLCEELSTSPQQQLEQRLASALEHHPQVTSFEVLAFRDVSIVTTVAAHYGFLPTSKRLMYARQCGIESQQPLNGPGGIFGFRDQTG